MTLAHPETDAAEVSCARRRMICALVTFAGYVSATATAASPAVVRV